MELREKEEAEEEEAKAAAKASEAAALMHKANLDGVDALFDDMIAGDDEWAKLSQVCAAIFQRALDPSSCRMCVTCTGCREGTISLQFTANNSAGAYAS